MPMFHSERSSPILYRAVDGFFWLLLLASQLPVASALQLLGRLLILSDLFHVFIADLVRWRTGG